MDKVWIFDTTLRDGEQSPGCSMNIAEKIEIARQLVKLKVDVIEAGFAISSSGDFRSVEAIAKNVKGVRIASLARALEKDIDAAYEAVKEAEDPLIHTFLATSRIHMEHKLKKTEDEVLEQTVAMVKYAKKYCSQVEFSAEDAVRSDPMFLARVCQGAIKAGATVINIPDTVGYATPNEMQALISYLMRNVEGIDKVLLSVHCHNDLGMAVANSLAGVAAGARQVECTVNGIGERAGNAALEEIVMAIKTRSQTLGVDTSIETQRLYRTSKLVYNILGLTLPINKAIVGSNAFAHESGIHQHGVQADRMTYEIISPEDVGLKKNNIVLGKHSGKHAFMQKLEELGIEAEEHEVEEYFEKFKVLCDKKKLVSDLDIEAIVHNKEIKDPKAYKLVRFDIHSGNFSPSTCVIKLRANNKNYEKVALGDGPVDAAFKAIDKIVGGPRRSLEAYNIHAVTEGKDAQGEVIVKIKVEDTVFTGRGVSMDILEASILAYINGMNKILSQEGVHEN